MFVTSEITLKINQYLSQRKYEEYLLLILLETTLVIPMFDKPTASKVLSPIINFQILLKTGWLRMESVNMCIL